MFLPSTHKVYSKSQIIFSNSDTGNKNNTENNPNSQKGTNKPVENQNYEKKIKFLLIEIRALKLKIEKLTQSTSPLKRDSTLRFVNQIQRKIYADSVSSRIDSGVSNKQPRVESLRIRSFPNKDDSNTSETSSSSSNSYRGSMPKISQFQRDSLKIDFDIQTPKSNFNLFASQFSQEKKNNFHNKQNSINANTIKRKSTFKNYFVRYFWKNIF